MVQHHQTSLTCLLQEKQRVAEEQQRLEAEERDRRRQEEEKDRRRQEEDTQRRLAEEQAAQAANRYDLPPEESDDDEVLRYTFSEIYYIILIFSRRRLEVEASLLLPCMTTKPWQRTRYPSTPMMSLQILRW